jgi:hypothetical protein
MTDLSPAVQAIVNAAVEAGGGYGRATPTLHARLATALRAAADQVVPEEPDGGMEPRWIRQSVRRKLLAIADELQAQ